MPRGSNYWVRVSHCFLMVYVAASISARCNNSLIMRFYSYRWRQAGERFRGGRVGTAHVQCYVNANFTPSSRLCFLGFDFAELPVFLASGLYAWLTLAICGLCTRWTVAVVRHSYGLLTLRPDEIVTLQKGEPQKGAPIALVGAGTNQTAPLFRSSPPPYPHIVLPSKGSNVRGWQAVLS